MSSQVDEYKYKMAHPRRGIAVIINNENFKTLEQRKGTQVDEEKMTERLRALKFEVKAHRNKTGNDMKKIMREAASENHSDCDCFVCVILSHGEPDKVHGTDVPVQVNELLEPFKGDQCKSLVGKPKIFFIQACRGKKKDHGVLSVEGDGPGDKFEKKIPIEADFLVVYSSVPGYLAWRNGRDGSWFIRALWQSLDKHILQKSEHDRDLDLMTLMTRVNMEVSKIESSCEDPEFDGKKQIPCITSMLTKDIYFQK